MWHAWLAMHRAYPRVRQHDASLPLHSSLEGCEEALLLHDAARLLLPLPQDCHALRAHHLHAIHALYKAGSGPPGSLLWATVAAVAAAACQLLEAAPNMKLRAVCVSCIREPDRARHMVEGLLMECMPG